MKKAAGLLAVDVDGTLITDNGAITDEVYNALERVVSFGWEIIIASGRTFHAAQPVIEKLPFVRYAALSNGASILDVIDLSIVHSIKLPPATVEQIITISREYGVIPSLYDSDIFCQHVYYDTLDGACDYFRWYVEKDPRCVLVSDILGYIGDIMQIGMVEKKEIIFTVQDALREVEATLIAVPFENVHFGGKNHDYWVLQIVGKDAQKNKALRRMAGILKIPEGRLVAVGDNYNDADMIKGADIGVAMGNAPEDIKKLARVVVASNNHSGLAQVVDEVILSGQYFS
jgi:Cof subfamily protein (haloacid dehalogenase superfamily)